MNPGSPKICGLEIIDGRHLPDDGTGTADHERLPGQPRLPLPSDGAGLGLRE
jgi:hypothetical protein